MRDLKLSTILFLHLYLIFEKFNLIIFFKNQVGRTEIVYFEYINNFVLFEQNYITIKIFLPKIQVWVFLTYQPNLIIYSTTKAYLVKSDAAWPTHLS